MEKFFDTLLIILIILHGFQLRLNYINKRKFEFIYEYLNSGLRILNGQADNEKETKRLHDKYPEFYKD